MSDSLSYHQLDELNPGDVVIDRHGREWCREGNGDWSCDETYDYTETGELFHKGPLTMGPRMKFRTSGFVPGSGEESYVTLLLMSDGTVKWEVE